MRKIVLIILLLLFSSTIFSQTLKLRIGSSFSKLNWENSITQDVMYDNTIIGLDVSLEVDYLNFKYFNLSSGIGFIQKGGKDSIYIAGIQNPEGTLSKVKTTLHYLTVNTTFQAKIPIKDFISPFLAVGPRLDYLISYKEDASLIKGFENYGELNKFIFGLVVGGGINFHIKKIQLGIVFDYYFNFNRLVDYTLDNGASNKIYDRTYTLNISIGYKL